MKALLLAGVVAVSWIGVAKAAVIDFATLPGNNGDAVTTYSENGFKVTAESGNVKVATVVGNQGIYFDLFQNASGSVTVDLGGSTFTLTSVDLRSGSGAAAVMINYTITGFLGSVQAFTQTGSAMGGPANTPFLTVLSLQPGTLIDRLLISESTAGAALSGNLDNIVVQPAMAAVPEPASLALFGVNLAGVVAARRRRAA